MEQEKKYVAGWVLWLFLIFTIIGVITTFLSYGGLFTKTIIENEVFEHSYQKQAGDKEAKRNFNAQAVILKQELENPNLTEQESNNIKAELKAISILNQSKGDY